MCSQMHLPIGPYVKARNRLCVVFHPSYHSPCYFVLGRVTHWMQLKLAMSAMLTDCRASRVCLCMAPFHLLFLPHPSTGIADA